MATKVAINGFGRIGRAVARVILQRPELGLELVAINDLAPVKSLAHMFKYDTVMGKWAGAVSADEKGLVVDGKTITVTAERSPANLPWAAMGVDIVLESTGIFTSKTSEKGGYGDHITAGAKKVVLSVPSKDAIDATVVLGVNNEELTADVVTASNASCTTNCLAPVAKVLNDAFGLKRGLMTTVHAYANDQRVNDMIHSDLRRARAAAANIIPTSTGAAKAVGKVIPALNGKLNGCAMRVPVADGSCVDLVAELEKPATVEEINAAVKAAAEGPMKGILCYTEDPIVSSDIVGDPHSSIFDALSTMVIDGNMIKIVSWYDNEWGYSNRAAELMSKMAAML